MCTVPLFLMNKISIFNLYPKGSLNSVIYSVLQFQFKVQVLTLEVICGTYFLYFVYLCVQVEDTQKSSSFIKWY